MRRLTRALFPRGFSHGEIFILAIAAAWVLAHGPCRAPAAGARPRPAALEIPRDSPGP